jgi:acyl dehydratase
LASVVNFRDLPTVADTHLSLGPVLQWEILTVEGADQVVNYALNKARFPALVRVGTRLPLSADCGGVDEVSGEYQATLALTFEIEDQAKPACVAEILFRYYGPMEASS